jgi:(E)-4-hydroxy-3-methylbut-2-enyl-diphosphate synthase
MADLSTKEKITPATLFSYGYHYSVPLDKWNLTDQACDYLFIGDHHLTFEIPGTLGIVQEHATWLKDRNKSLSRSWTTCSTTHPHRDLNFVRHL